MTDEVKVAKKSRSQWSRRLVGFVLMISAVTAYNYWRAGSSIQETCEDQPGSYTDTFCDCYKSKVLRGLGIEYHLPLVGRVLGPDAAEARQISNDAAQICTTEAVEDLQLNQ